MCLVGARAALIVKGGLVLDEWAWYTPISVCIKKQGEPTTHRVQIQQVKIYKLATSFTVTDSDIHSANG